MPVSNYETEFIAKLEQIIVSSGGSVPPMTGPTNFQLRSLELLDAINVAAGGSTNASSVAFTPAGNIAATNVQAAIAELDTEKTNAPVFSVYKNTAQSFSDVAFTLVTWDAEVRDTDNAFANNTFTVPANKGGLYYFQAKLTLGPNILRALIVLYKNGVEAVRLYDEYIDLDLLTAGGVGLLDLIPGDQITLYLLLDTANGGSASTMVSAPAQTFSQFSGFRLIA
ncbi:MAG TPA: hypothetical protein V6C63_16165 [Allocoleopsis sp.]